MGYHRHHAIVVTSYREQYVKAAHADAVSIFDGTACAVSAVTPVAINGYCSFFVAPDGSKEGWGDSDTADRAREDFIAAIERRGRTWNDARGFDTGYFVNWAMVEFGGDDEDFMEVRGPEGQLRGRVEPAVVLGEEHRAAS
jgi:hypothetical protein